MRVPSSPAGSLHAGRAALLSCLALLVLGCSGGAAGGQATSTASPAPTTPAAASTGTGSATSTANPAPVILKITKGGQVVRTWSLDQLKAEVPFHRATVDGEQQEGPLLVDVLRASNVGAWTSGEVLGQGPQRSFAVSMAIRPDSIDGTWILDVNQQGSLKLAVPSKPRDQWARFVSEIRLQ